MTEVSEIKVEEFLEQKPGLCFSIYMPTHRTGRDVKQNAIRFKNLLGQLKKELEERRIPRKNSEELLQPLQELHEDGFFWNHQSDGLALFRTEDKFLKYRVPYSFPEVAMVGNGFYLKPLIPVIVKNREFYLLTLDLNNPGLYHVTMDGISEMKLRDVPSSIEEALKHTVFEKNVQWHTKAPGAGAGDRQAMFHGQGVGSDDLEKKKYISDYFHMMNKGLNRELNNKSLPMLLMGVEYLLPIYREVNSYPKLVDRSFDKDPGSLKRDELHRESWQFMESHFDQVEEEAREKYQKAVGAHQTGERVEDIVPAAYDGRIDLLFIQNAEPVWGTFHPQNHEVTLSNQKNEAKAAAESVDLVDFAAVHTLHKDGQVLVVDEADIPGGGKLAAIYRY